jgi:hypothetical protein
MVATAVTEVSVAHQAPVASVVRKVRLLQRVLVALCMLEV